ncbi:MAG: GNAT family N-acetyltransferase [Euryarchaeota archaeon]|nr:GNAT family N-acetyltransferase [Euryarchaeota archaeon]
MKHGLVWEDTVDEAHLDLRFWVLREGLPRGTEHYPGIDDDSETKFLCAYEKGELIGCSTLQIDEREGCRFRIRGMAVSPNHRNRGIGSSIVRELQKYASSEGSGIWCNARIRAVPMYRRCGFVEVSDVFEIEGIGLHFDMEWRENVSN